MRVALISALVSVSTFAIALPASAALVAPTSYDMRNGDGQATGGTFNYWDRSYSGAGATTTDGAALSGGLGDLTDGVVAPNLWYLTENTAGTGPYVGWRQGFRPDPVVTFHFASATTITGIGINLDNSGLGGVFAPSAILVDGVAQAYSAPASGTFGWVNLTGLNLTGSAHTIEFDQPGNSGQWTFVSEVQFNGTSGAPEPATWAMMIGGFGLAGAALRRRRPATA